MGSKTEKSAPVRLGFNDHDTQVVITPATMDLFVYPASTAASACASHAQQVAFRKTMQDRFVDLMNSIGKWCEARPTVARAYFDYRDGGQYFLLFVVKSDQPDAGLGDDIADLALHLRKSFPEFPLSVMTIPESRVDAVSAFVDPAKAFSPYPYPHADTSGASRNR